LGKPMGKTHRWKIIEENDDFFFVAMLKLINYDYKRFFLLKLTRIDDVEIDVVLLAVLVWCLPSCFGSITFFAGDGCNLVSQSTIIN
jgi:hypothetical protein